MQYKTVAAPTNLTIGNKDSMSNAVAAYADIINKEAQQGWEFHSLGSIYVTQNPSCIGGLCGKAAETNQYGMLVFKK